MKWEGGERSDNVEDRRGGAAKPVAIAGGGIVTVIVLIAAYFLGVDPKDAQQAANAIGGAGQQQQPAGPGKDDKTREFAEVILNYTEKVWDDRFKNDDFLRSRNVRYEKPKFVLFNDSVDTKCGTAPSAVGPFYCPGDHKLYLDPSFFDELETKLGGSKGDFSKAYVIAHEVGHHVQNLLGYSRKADAKRGTAQEKDASVRLELQADYLAGVWAFYGQKQFKFIEPGDVESALKTANAIGDDRLQKRSKGWTSPESYTHGTAAQREKWFREGLRTGNLKELDHFFETRSSQDL